MNSVEIQAKQSLPIDNQLSARNRTDIEDYDRTFFIYSLLCIQIRYSADILYPIFICIHTILYSFVIFCIHSTHLSTVSLSSPSFCPIIETFYILDASSDRILRSHPSKPSDFVELPTRPKRKAKSKAPTTTTSEEPTSVTPPRTPTKESDDQEVHDWIATLPEHRTFPPVGTASESFQSTPTLGSQALTLNSPLKEQISLLATRLHNLVRKESESPHAHSDVSRTLNGTPPSNSTANRIPTRSPSQTPNMPKTEEENNRENSDVSSDEEYLDDGSKITVEGKPIWRNTSEIIKLLKETTKKFSEGSATDLTEWLNGFGRSLYRIDVPQATGITLLPFFLRNPALDKYNSLEDRERKTWKRVTSALLKLHQCEADKEIAIQEISNCTQGKGSVRDFAGKIRKLGTYAYDDLDKAARDRLMATHLLNGVSKNIRLELRRLPSTPKTLREMALQAEKIERLQKIEADEDEEEDARIAAVQMQFPENQQRGHFNARGRGYHGGYQSYNQGYNQDRRRWQPAQQRFWTCVEVKNTTLAWIFKLASIKYSSSRTTQREQRLLVSLGHSSIFGCPWGLKDVQARIFVYIDDLIITSRSAAEHLQDIDEVLGRIEDIGMKLKAEKSKFAMKEIRFLGFLVSKDGIRADPEKTKAVAEFPRPKTVKDVRAFLGMASFYRRFVENFSKIAIPLCELTKKDVAFNWTMEREKAFQQLKDALISDQVLAAPKLGKPFVIEVDSSGLGVGAVLSQYQDKEEKDLKVIAYASRTYNIHERNYVAIELEALGLVFAVHNFRPYIDGARTTVITDHSPLKALLHRKDLTGRLARFQIAIQGYDIHIVYRPGKQNTVCDTLSRYHPEMVNTLNRLLNIDFAKIREEQTNDERILESRKFIRSHLVQNDIVFTKGEKDEWVIFLPHNSAYGQELAKMIHESIFEGAHLGRDKTESRVRSIACWKGMTRAIQKVVEQCQVCQKTKDPIKNRIHAPLGKFETPSSPFERVHADYIGPLPETTQGNIYIAVFVDAFSKFIIAEPARNQTAESLCNIFKDRVVSRFGPPKQLVTDRGTNFTSKKFKEVLETLNIDHSMSTAYHHEANGQVERANQTIEQMLRQCKDDEEWDTELQTLLHAYNTAQNATTGVSPHMVMHGQDARSPLRNILSPRETTIQPRDHVEKLKKKTGKLYDECAKRIEKRTIAQQVKHGEKNLINNPEINIGDRIWIRRAQRNKIGAQFEGPYEVKEVQDPNIIVKLSGGPRTRGNQERTRIAHKNRCKLHIEGINPTENNGLQ
uniref:RNA-directed DNA polymerase n=1 Tax=Caenorhabditis japonica TaxID=281687 RepID=A0A8R1HSY5_CAEJA